MVASSKNRLILRAMTRLTGALLAVVLIMSAPLFCLADPLGEAVGDWSNASGWARPELEEAEQAGLIPQALNDKDLTQPITRSEFAAVAVLLYEKWTGKSVPLPNAVPFTDIAGDANFVQILKAYALGVTNGTSANSFEPATLITREQLATMLCRVYKAKQWPDWTLATDGDFTLDYSGVAKFVDDENISEYAKPAVYFMVKNGVIAGMDGYRFAPRNMTPEQEAASYATATREQAILISLRSFKNLG